MPENNYKQIRITVTEEACRGHKDRVNLTCRVMLKPVGAQWNLRHTILHTHEVNVEPLSDMGAVFRALSDLFRQPPLPGSID